MRFSDWRSTFRLEAEPQKTSSRRVQQVPREDILQIPLGPPADFASATSRPGRVSLPYCNPTWDPRDPHTIPTPSPKLGPLGSSTPPRLVLKVSGGLLSGIILREPQRRADWKLRGAHRTADVHVPWLRPRRPAQALANVTTSKFRQCAEIYIYIHIYIKPR